MGAMDISLWNPYFGGVFLRKHYAVRMEHADRPRHDHLPHDRHAPDRLQAARLPSDRRPDRQAGLPGDGIAQGSWTNDEHSGGARDATYNWHLEAQP